MRELRRLKATHPVKYSNEFPKGKLTELEQYANVDDVKLKRAPLNTLEGVANTLILNGQHAEQLRIKANPPVFDRAYVERSDYSIMSFYSDYKDDIEGGNATWSDYREERKKWRKCKHNFCLNMYPTDKDNFKGTPAKRSDSRFCCEDCKDKHHESLRRFKETGSYLPRWYYVPALDETVGDRTRRRELAVESDVMEREININRPLRYAPLKKEKPPVYPVKTYNLADLSDEEIKRKKLEKYAEKMTNSRGENPYISNKVGTQAGSVSATIF